VIGANGTIGSAVVDALADRHEVVRASRRGPVRVDLTEPASLDRLFATVPEPDAVVCCAASGPLVSLDTVTDDEFAAGLHGKLLGQVALVRRALGALRDGGSITLTGGTFVTPLAGGSLGALVNDGLSGFVRNAAAELPRPSPQPGQPGLGSGDPGAHRRGRLRGHPGHRRGRRVRRGRRGHGSGADDPSVSQARRWINPTNSAAIDLMVSSPGRPQSLVWSATAQMVPSATPVSSISGAPM
jgi:hypothetical protein